MFSICCVRVLMSLLMPYLSGSKPFVSNYSSIEYTITCLYRVHPWLHVCLCYAINGQVVYTCSEIVYKMVYSCLKGNDLKSKCINDNKSLNSILLFSKILVCSFEKLDERKKVFCFKNCSDQMREKNHIKIYLMRGQTLFWVH